MAKCLTSTCNRLAGHTGKCDPASSDFLKCLPLEIGKKIRKTSQTRGAQPYDRVIFQNRVGRSNKVVIPYRFRGIRPAGGTYENGYSILVRPEEYFDPTTKRKKVDFPEDVVIGSETAFIYYDTRNAWREFPPLPDWVQRVHRIGDKSYTGLEAGFQRKTEGQDLGHFVARVPGLTSSGTEAESIVLGPPQGIRFFEYTPTSELRKIEIQLALLATRTIGFPEDQTDYLVLLNALAASNQLSDLARLIEIGVMSTDGRCMCPLCRKPVELREFIDQVEQVEGREVMDLTVTQANLFHINEIRPGEFNHRSYNLGWGHHHCNAVARDNGIQPTIDWMLGVLERNGYRSTKK